MRKTILTVVAAALALYGCAHAPNTPGAGAGSNYTPVIDLDGVDGNRYTKDLDSCRRYANTINANASAMTGAVGGAIFGAVIAAAFGVKGRANTDIAVYGAGAGGAGSAARAMQTQERIITNCMAGRGYRTLDAPFMAVPASQSPYNQPVAAQPSATQAMNVSSAPAATTVPVVAHAPIGESDFQVQRVAKDQSCNAQPQPALAAKGAGFETYTVACTNGDSLMVRCEFGNCRVLR